MTRDATGERRESRDQELSATECDVECEVAAGGAADRSVFGL